MQEKTREKLIFVIGVLAFIIAGVSFVFSALDLLSVLQAADWQISKALQSSQAYDMAVDLVFAGLELAMGLILIKQWREKERVEVYKTLSKLINAVVYASFVQSIFGMVMAYAVDKSSSGLNVSIVYCIVYLVYYVLTASSGTLLRKRQWMPLYITMLIASALAVGFCVYDCITVVKASAAAVEIGTTFANTLLMGLIVAFSVGVVVFYAKDPNTLWRDVLEGEDYDVVGRSDGYEVVRIYANRAQEGAMNVLILVLYVFCAVVGITAIVFYAMENQIGQYFGGSIQALIDNVQSAMLSGGVGEMLQVMMLFMIVLAYPLIFLSHVLGSFQRQASSKINVLSIVSIGTLMTLLVGVGTIIEVMFDFINYRNIRWENYSLFEAVLIVLYLVFKLTKRIYANTTKEINDGIMQGDSYHSHSGVIARICLFSGIYSVVALGLIFAMNCVEGNVCVSYLLFAVAILFAAAGALLEAKYPFSEFEKAKRKIVEVKESAEKGEAEQERTTQAT